MTDADLGDQARLISLTVGDDPASWTAAGFTVSDHPHAAGCVTVGPSTIVLSGQSPDGSGRGVQSWTVGGLKGAGTGDIDGIVTGFEEVTDPDGSTGPSSGPDHANGATGIDHVVIITPDLERTTDAFGERGLAVRRIRDTESYGAPMRQAFLRLGPSIVEVVAPAPKDDADLDVRPAAWFGLALEVDDLDKVAALLGDGLGSVKPAVQAGQRIATIRHRTYDISVAVALMDRRG
ncbi:MAG: VOC family protein [Microthrixaceae bacterium]|nr:VOC family protein [Acidimicrobiales bacterium]MCB9403886.1 VOC family protein [Microthrixaceae bacterium]